MGKLTLNGIQYLLENWLNKNPLSVLVQAISIKNKPAEKVWQQVSISWGNLHVWAVIPMSVKDYLEVQNKPFTISLYDVVQITSCKVSWSVDKTILVIKDMNIIKTGLESKIGGPVSYDECKMSGNFPIIKEENTIYPDLEEEFEYLTISPSPIKK